VKFFVDRCAGRRLAEWLRREGHDVAMAADRGPDPGDRELLAMSHSDGRILVTMDKDFGQFVFVENLPHSGIVRLPDVRVDERIALMRGLLSGRLRDRIAGAVVTVELGRVRISRPGT
jgi:predicted nuclease of predicted toxin-antitoxin system